MPHVFSAYEEKVGQLIDQLVAAHRDRLTLFSGDGGATGYYWELVPKNPRGAKAHVYAVTQTSINLSIENFYWVHIPVEKGAWDQALLVLGGYLQAVIDGRVTGWFGRDDKGKPQYVLEFTAGEEEPVQFISNVHFASLFKNRGDITQINYQQY